jgi:prepilin-type processing-associated H-X9-DG protein
MAKMKFKTYQTNSILIFACFLFAAFIAWIILSAVLPYKPPEKIICSANIRALKICTLIYHDDNKSWPANNWCDLIKPYVENENPKDFQCPSDKIGPCSYAMNVHIPAEAEELPGDLVVLFESAPGWNAVGGVADVVTDRHGRPGANIAFADGRVEFVEAADIAKLRWVVEDEQMRGAGVTR